MKNDKIKELKDNEMAQVTGGTGPHCHFEQVSGNLAGAASQANDHNMPKPTSDEKYIMTTSAPTADEIISELRS